MVGVIDFAVIFADPDKPWTARPELRASAGNVHFNAAGQKMRAQALAGTIQLPSSSARNAAELGPYDSGLRNINSLVPDLELWQYPGSTQAHRVHASAPRWTSTSTTSAIRGRKQARSLSSELPLGFRPPASVFVRTFRGNNAVVQWDGQVRIYNPGTALDYVNWSFLTRNEARPGQEPGSPA